METTTAPEIKIINFSELKNLDVDGYQWHHLIPIKRSENPRCIYKTLKYMDGMGLYVHVFKKSNQNRNNGIFNGIFNILSSPKNDVDVTIYELMPIHEHWKMKFNLPEIEIVVDEKIKIEAAIASTHRDNNYISLVGEKSSLKINLPNRVSTGDVGTLIEKDGKFYRDRYGVLFEVIPYDYNGNYHNSESLLNTFQRTDITYTDRNQTNRFLKKVADDKDVKFELDKSKVEGVSKTLTIIQPFYDELVKDRTDMLSLISFVLAVEATKRTINNVKFSVIFNKIFSEVKTKDEFNTKLKEMSDILEKVNTSYNSPDGRDYHTMLMDSIPEAREIKKAALKRKSTGAINKIMDDLDFIKIDKDKYPLTHEAIFSGEIPKGTFFRKSGDSYFVYNDNWEIWEDMLVQHKDVAIDIAKEASRRTTYEKDLMSYFFFVLHKLPEYLERQTGKKWKCFPGEAILHF